MISIIRKSMVGGRKSQRFLIYAVIMSYLFMLVLSESGFLRKSRNLFSKDDAINLNSSAHSFHPPGTYEFNVALAKALFLVIMAGICSGLNVGLLSIDQVALKVKLRSGTEYEKDKAEKILKILEDHHLLLSTLLVANALAMESLPIYLHEVIPAALAVIVSTLVVVIFGEILPQAVCTGPKQFEIASMSIPIIKFLELIFLVICWPIAKFLDWLLGKHDSSKFQKNKKDLKALIELHSYQNDIQSNHLQEFGFNHQEVQMLSSTLDLREQPVTKKMIKLDDVFMLSTDEIFSKNLINKIKLSGFSSIPIFERERQNIIGCLRTKIILKCESKHLNKPIARRFPLADPLMIAKDTNMLQMIQLFQLKKCSLAFITNEEKIKKENKEEQLYLSNRDMIVDHFTEVLGVIFLKDLFEEIVDIDFQDNDQHINQPDHHRQ